MLCSFVAQLELMSTARESSKGHTARGHAPSLWLTGSDYPLSPPCPEQESPSREDLQCIETPVGWELWRVPSPNQGLSLAWSLLGPAYAALVTEEEGARDQGSR